MDIMKDNRFNGQNVLITGGSSGLGLAVADEFGRLGAHLHLIARDMNKLEQAQQLLHQKWGENLEVNIYSVDVSDKDAVNALITQIGNSPGGIHSLINNAGILLNNRFGDIALEALEEALQINYNGMLYMTHAAWPYLKQAQNGHIGFVSSIAGYLGLLGYSAYSPSKFAIAGLAESLRLEAKDIGVGVTIIYPSDIDTPMLVAERKNGLPDTRALAKNTKVLSPEFVAKKFVKAMLNRKFEVLFTLENRLLRLFKAVWPGLMFRILDGIVYKDRKRRSGK